MFTTLPLEAFVCREVRPLFCRRLCHCYTFLASENRVLTLSFQLSSTQSF